MGSCDNTEVMLFKYSMDWTELVQDRILWNDVRRYIYECGDYQIFEQVVGERQLFNTVR